MSETEQAIVKVFPELMQATQHLVAYHWDNFKASQSGLPLFTLGSRIVTHGMKLRPGEESSLWTTILRPSPEARHAFVQRRIGIFLAQIKDAVRLKKKVNLGGNAQAFRDKHILEEAWEMSAVYAHFLRQFRAMMSEGKFKELEQKFQREYVDQELKEKARTKLPGLEWNHFCFLAILGVQGVSGGPSDDSQGGNPTLEQHRWLTLSN